MIGEELLRYNKKKIYLATDCESCNLNVQNLDNKPWEWAWCRFTLDGVIEEKSVLVQWPEIKIGKKAAEMTGFYQGKIDTYGVSPEEALEELEAQLYDKSCGKSTDYSYLNRLIDTNCIARAVAHNLTPPKDPLDFLAFQYKMAGLRTKGIKTSQKALCAEYGIPYDESCAHSGIYDVGLLREIWKQLVWKCEI